MVMPENEIEQDIALWKKGELSTNLLRTLPSRIGRAEYREGISVLLELAFNRDAIVRYNAVMSLGFKLRFRDATDVLIKVLKDDSDIDCRDAAAGALGAMWRNTRDRRVVEKLTQIVLNDKDDDVRKAAYSSLITVDGISDEDYLEMLQNDRQPVNSTRVASILAGYAQ